MADFGFSFLTNHGKWFRMDTIQPCMYLGNFLVTGSGGSYSVAGLNVSLVDVFVEPWVSDSGGFNENSSSMYGFSFNYSWNSSSGIVSVSQAVKLNPTGGSVQVRYNVYGRVS